jgi:hypothetical protein
MIYLNPALIGLASPSNSLGKQRPAKKTSVNMNNIEPFHQAYTYDTGNNLTTLSHQANSGDWQQTLAIHPYWVTPTLLGQGLNKSSIG